MFFFKKKTGCEQKFETGWEQKLEAMQSLSGVAPSGNPLLAYRNGEWSCRIPGAIIAGGGVTLGDSGRGPSPEKAVIAAWEKLSSLKNDSYLETESYPDKSFIRIAGCTFVDV